MALAERLDEAGELRRMTVLLREELGSLPAGPQRARALILLVESDAVTSRQDQELHLQRALGECGEERNLRAQVLAKLAGNAAAAAVCELAQAQASVGAGGAARRGRADGDASRALWSLAWPLALSGRPLDELCARSSVAADTMAYISASPERVAAMRLFWRGEVASARASLDSLAALADERGDLTSYAMIRMHRVEVELRSGNFDAAQRLLEEWGESSDFETQFRPQYPRCRALLAAGRGAAAEATRWAHETIELAQNSGSKWDELEARRALGIAAMIAPAPGEAPDQLSAVWDHCEREAVLEPPELVEALAELDRFADAGEVTERLGELAARQDHPWARATAKRCAALVELAKHGYDDPSGALLHEASVELESLEARFDSARCLLALGRAQRRAKRWRGARQTLERAIGAFSALGAEGWVQRARSELERVGGRRRADGKLTPSEQRVAELAGQGLSNKEIAAAPYVSVNTVEVHLARVPEARRSLPVAAGEAARCRALAQRRRQGKESGFPLFLSRGPGPTVGACESDPTHRRFSREPRCSSRSADRPGREA